MDEPRTTLDTILGYHFVIKGELHQHPFPDFLDVSGVAICEHLEGKVQKERPHYHCWVPRTSLHVDKWKKDIIRPFYDSQYPDPKALKWNTHANSYYMFKEHDSYSDWEKYVARDPEVKKGSWIRWNRPGVPPPIEPGIAISDFIVTGPVNTIIDCPIKVVRKSSLEKQIKFLNYVKSCVDESDYDTLTPEILTDYVFEYCGKNEFVAMNAAYTFINYALSQLLTGDARARYKERFRSVICSKFF